uniref:CD1g molecule n=1 Tax=Gallus gallus TaxID=9031 RepID=A0A8V0XJV3_CHICK
MQPHAILLLFFFPGTTAEPEALFPSPAGSHMLKLLHFATFQNSTSVLVGGLGLLGDVKMGSLDSRTGNIRYYRPWLRPSLPKGDWDVIESSIKSYVRDFSRLVQMYTTVPYPFVFQSSIGCELQSNGTIRTFFDIAYEGQNFLRFNLDAGTWDQMQHNQLSAKAEHLMANASTLNEVIQVLLNDTCVDILRLFIQAGKADLERQGNGSGWTRCAASLWRSTGAQRGMGPPRGSTGAATAKRPMRGGGTSECFSVLHLVRAPLCSRPMLPQPW